MNNSNIVRDGFEGLFVVAIGAMLGSVVLRLKRHQISPYRCIACGGATSRAYPRCRHCGHSSGNA